MKRTVTDEMRCSFCHKGQDVVGKLISSPSEFPRAYICDECIAVCNSILKEDKSGKRSPTEGEVAERSEPTQALGQFVLAHDATVDLSDSLYKQVQEVALARRVPVGDVIASALSEYVAALDRLQRKAHGASREALLETLENAPDNEPAEYDRR